VTLSDTPFPGLAENTPAPARIDDNLNDAAIQVVLSKLEQWRRRLKPEQYGSLVSELVRVGKEQGGEEEEFWCAFEDEYCPPTGWEKEWQAGTLLRPGELVRWLRNRSASIKALAERFPPLCIVRGLIALRCPRTDHVAIVSNYFEPSAAYPIGSLGVVAHPKACRPYVCAPEALEVTGYYKGLNCELFCHLLARQSQ